MSLKEMAAAVRLGASLESVAPEGADLNYLRRIINRINAGLNKPKRKRHNYYRRSGRPCKRSNYAAQVVARAKATVELVERVNSQEDEADNG